MDDRKGNRIHRCSCQRCKSRRHPEVAEYHRSINRVMSEFDERSRRLSRDCSPDNSDEAVSNAFAKSPACRARRLTAGSANVIHHSRVNLIVFGVLVVAES